MSKKRTINAARSQFLSEQAVCYDVDGTRPGKKRWVVGVGASMVDSQHNSHSIDTLALVRAARKIRSNLGVASPAATPGAYQNPLFVETNSTSYDGNEGMFDPFQEPPDVDSDVGSDDEEEAYTIGASAIVVRPTIHIQASLSPYTYAPRTVHPSRSRFQSWHNRVAQVFDITYGPNPPSSTDIPQTLECACPESILRKHLYIKVYDVGHSRTIDSSCCHRHLIERLLSVALFPASPSRPEVAFSMHLLRWFQTLIDQTGLGANNMAETIESFVRRGTSFQRSRTPFDVPDTLRKQLRNAITWVTVIECYAAQMALDSRPAWIETRPHAFKAGPPSIPGSEFGPQVIISMDGNFTQKRKCRVDSIRKQPFPPRRFLSQSQVYRAAADWDAASGTNPDKESCIANIRAIDHQASQQSNNPYDITGIMGACCRHDIPLVMCDMRTEGERHYYAIALIRAIIKAVGTNLTHLGIAYDIGCRFDPSTKVTNLFANSGVKLSWSVPVFHVYGHTYSCQLKYNPRNLPGFGHTDGEGMERVWSGLANLIGTHRNMSEGERRFSLEQRCEFIASERRLGIFKHLANKERRLVSTEQQTKPSLTLDFDPSAIPSKFITSTTQNSNARQPPAEFAGISASVYASWKWMGWERTRLLDQTAAQRKQAKPSVADAVAVFSGSLLRILAEVRLLRGLMHDKSKSAARGTRTVVRLALCMKTEKANARKAMINVNRALVDEHPDDKATNHRPSWRPTHCSTTIPSKSLKV
ncbi:unnamed protein product [Tilletia controversa]|nr:unnamed protein product [Tilletia controversa]